MQMQQVHFLFKIKSGAAFLFVFPLFIFIQTKGWNNIIQFVN